MSSQEEIYNNALKNFKATNKPIKLEKQNKL
jgi:hypothetical protein